MKISQYNFNGHDWFYNSEIYCDTDFDIGIFLGVRMSRGTLKRDIVMGNRLCVMGYSPDDKPEFQWIFSYLNPQSNTYKKIVEHVWEEVKK